LTDRLTIFADKPYGIRLELEHVKFVLHRENCSSLCPILTSVSIRPRDFDVSRFVYICLDVRLLVSYPSLNTIKTYFLLSFKVYKALKKSLN